MLSVPWQWWFCWTVPWCSSPASPALPSCCTCCPDPASSSPPPSLASPDPAPSPAASASSFSAPAFGPSASSPSFPSVHPSPSPINKKKIVTAILPTANSRIIVNREMRHKNETLRWSYLLPVYRRAIDRSCNLAHCTSNISYNYGSYMP